MNTQLPMKQDRTEDGKLLVHSIFHTIQGEGPLVGIPSVFVRLGGCNLQCPGCDTEYTEGVARETIKYISELVTSAFKLRGTLKGLHSLTSIERPLVVLTGGEPFRQRIWPLLYILIKLGYQVQIETNGTLFQKPLIDDLPILKYLSIVCSPKTGAIAPSLTQYVTALKYVGKAGNIDQSDGLPILALDHPAAPRVARPPDRFKGRVYLQPMDEQDDEKNAQNLAAVVSACKKFGHTLCLQTHKMIGEQ